MTKLTLSKETLDILKNFQNINKSIDIAAGSVLKTISRTKTTYAEAKVAETFPVDFAFYDLPQFLQVIALYDNPEIEFHDTYCEVTGRQGLTRYMYASAAVKDAIVSAKDKNPKVPESDIEFALPGEVFKKALAASGVLNLQEICFRGDGEHVYIVADQLKNKSSNVFKKKLATTDKKFNLVMNRENLIFLDRDYKVLISERFVKFTDHSGNLYYLVGAEDTSDTIS